jgi:hypothetical protein
MAPTRHDLYMRRVASRARTDHIAAISRLAPWIRDKGEAGESRVAWLDADRLDAEQEQDRPQKVEAKGCGHSSAQRYTWFAAVGAERNG